MRGSPFVAPETLAGGELRNATDLYALGMLIISLLSQELPFDETDPGAIAQFSDQADAWLAGLALDPTVQSTITSMVQTAMGRRPLIASDVRFALIPRGALGRKAISGRSNAPQQAPGGRKKAPPQPPATQRLGDGDDREW